MFDLKFRHTGTRYTDGGLSTHYFHAMAQIIAPLIASLQSVPCRQRIAVRDDLTLSSHSRLLPTLIAPFQRCWSISLVNSTMYASIHAQDSLLSDRLPWNSSMLLSSRRAFYHFFGLSANQSKGKRLLQTIVAARSLRDTRRMIANIYKLDGLRTYTTSVCVMRLGLLSLYEQVNLMSRTDVLLGQHGADLTNMLFLPARAAVIQVSGAIFILHGMNDGSLCAYASGTRAWFEDMAVNLGHKYYWLNATIHSSSKNITSSSKTDRRSCRDLLQAPVDTKWNERPIIVTINVSAALQVIECAAHRLHHADHEEHSCITRFILDENRSHELPFFIYPEVAIHIVSSNVNLKHSFFRLERREPTVGELWSVLCMGLVLTWSHVGVWPPRLFLL